MKKKSAMTPLPKFKSDNEAAEYFEGHSVADVWDELPAARPVKPSAALMRKISDRPATAMPKGPKIEQLKTAVRG